MTGKNPTVVRRAHLDEMLRHLIDERWPGGEAVDALAVYRGKMPLVPDEELDGWTLLHLINDRWGGPEPCSTSDINKWLDAHSIPYRFDSWLDD